MADSPLLHPRLTQRMVWHLALTVALVFSGCVSQPATERTATTAVAAPQSSGGRTTLNFNPDWRFTKSDPANASRPAFNDGGWQIVSAPHTYNDVDTFDNWSVPGHRGEQDQWGGRTWYRKRFVLPESYRGKKVFIEFEATRQIAEVYLNGQLLGVHKTGFTPFGFDLTPHLRFNGQANVFAVMVDNRFMKDPLDAAAAAALGVATATTGGRSAPNPNLSQLHTQINATIPEKFEDLQADQIPWNNPHWHPAHGGLYRNVKLHVTDPLHITLPLYSFLETAGPYAYARNITSDSAQIGVDVPVRNDRASSENVELRVEIFDADNRSVLVLSDTQTIAPGASAEFKVAGQLARPRLWEPDYPHLYRVVSALRVNGATVDTSEIPLGVRAVRWDAMTGFHINGRHLKLRGWGQKSTNEWPGLGAAQPDWLQFHTMKLMRDAGGNMVRWGHTAGGPSQIFAGDRLGLIAIQPGVDGEHDTVGAAWLVRAQAFRDTIIYFRNSPSVLIWEGGNQKISREHALELRGYMDKYDPHGQRAYAHRRADMISAEFMDVGIGTEGGREIAHLPVVEGEYNREEAPRRVWDDASPPNFGYPEGKGQTYHLTSEQFAVNQVNHFVKKLGAPEHAGGANWIFSDSTSGGRVAVEVARASGEIDGVRLPKEAYWVCATMFRDDPQVHIIGHWTYPAGTTKPVYVASNGHEVELFVNGKSLGRGTVSDKYLFTFPNVAWEPGEIKAIAYRDGKQIATQSKRTAGEPVALRLTAITGPDGLLADGSDVVLLDVEAVDANGQRYPTVQQRVDFEVEGPGVWRGGYNSGKINSINHTYLDLEAGINRVSVRATREAGAITVRARSEGLKPGSITVHSKPFPVQQGFTAALPVLPEVTLPAQVPQRTVTARDTGTGRTVQGTGTAMLGRFVKTFNYSGPSNYIVHVEILARDGKNAYVDIDSPFANLPPQLTGADWVQAADKEALFHAVDLMELSVKGGTTVYVAHDDRLPRPPWLTRQFQPTDLSLSIAGQSMKVFARKIAQDEGLTFGANTEDPTIKTARMYVVFVNGEAAPAR